jgi:uncharacterized protein YbaA (DUF1428 family)
MRYVDGYVLPVPKRNLRAYRQIARKAGTVWKNHGALEYRECAGDDLGSKWGVPFPKLLKLKRGETVIFAWIVFKSRRHRDAVNAKVMKDPRMNRMMNPNKPPFDHKRMVYGGFEMMVDT